MDLKRFSIILLVFAVALMGLSWYVHRQAAERQRIEAEKAARAAPATAKAAPATRPASAPAPRPASAPASRPTSAPATVAATRAATAPASAPATQAATRPSGPIWLDTSTAGPGATVTIGSRDPASDYLFEVTLTNDHAAIQTVRLSRYFATVDDKQLAAKHKGDFAGYEAARAKDPGKYKGHYSVLNPVKHKDKRHLPLATRDLRIKLPGAAGVEYFPYWTLVGKTDTDAGQKVSFERIYIHGPKKLEDQALTEAVKKQYGILRVVKTYEIEKFRPRKDKDDPEPLGYTIRVTIALENLSDKPLTVELDQAGATGLAREALRGDQRAGAYGRFNNEAGKLEVLLKPIKEYSSRKTVGESDDKEKPGLWVGLVNQYFGSMLYLVPGPGQEGKLNAGKYAAEYYIEPIDESDDDKTHLTGVEIPGIKLAGGADRTIRFELFVGPKRRAMFDDDGDEFFRERYKALGYLSTINLGECWCTFDWLTLAMMWLLQKLSKLSAGNYGVAIFLLVIVVRLLLHPLTKKSQVSMVKMQKLAPMMSKLKEKYADDKETLNKEMMKLYKEQGAVPILGCLPMFLQMPIWIALYTALRASVELRHAAFLPVWITDLAAPDMLLTWSGDIKIITWATSNNLNLLPILLAVAMFLQTKFNPQMSGGGSPDQARQQSLMKWMMPTMMLFIFYKMPSGLNLYIMASTFASVGEQWIIRKHIQAREAAEAAVTTTVTIGGKAARGSRPKKPKGPFWVKKG